MSLQALIEASGARLEPSQGEAQNQVAQKIYGLKTDSRKVVPGDMFAAVLGSHCDGKDFVADAVARGATAVLLAEDAALPQALGCAFVLRTNDVRKAVGAMADAFFDAPCDALQTVGITGTNGKTSVAYLVARMLGRMQAPCGTVGTFGASFLDQAKWDTGLTTPDGVVLQCILSEMVAAGAQAVAMEISSHALAQNRVAGLRLDVGVWTHLSRDHLDYHGSMQAYAKAKALLWQRHLGPDGVGVVRCDEDAIFALRPQNTLGFSLRAPCQTMLEGCSHGVLWPDAWACGAWGNRCMLRHGDQKAPITTSLLGRIGMANLLAACGVGLALGYALDEVAAAAGGEVRIAGRLEQVSGTKGPCVLIDYAHTPDALGHALQSARAFLRSKKNGRLGCVFGSGGDRDQGKRSPMGEAVARKADWAVLTSDNPRNEDPNAIMAAVAEGLLAGGMQPASSADFTRKAASQAGSYVPIAQRDQAIAFAIEALGPEDVLVVAGKGHETRQIFADGSSQEFNDKTHAQNALLALGWPVLRDDA